MLKVIELKDLYYIDFNISNLFAMTHKIDNNRYFRLNKRTTSGLIYLKNCSAEYVFKNGETHTAPQSSILYLPQNSDYTIHLKNCKKNSPSAQLINFEFRDKNDEAFVLAENVSVINNDKDYIYSELFDEAVDIFCAPMFSFSAFKAAVYTLISEISKQYHKNNIYSKQFSSIAPAINYLEQNIASDISVYELSKMCLVSESCFRRLFKEYSGKTPGEYCTYIKIKHAKRLLRSDMHSVSDVADILGYEDIAYFSKVFKKYTGFPPSEYAKTRE